MKLEAEGQRAIADPQSDQIGSAVSLLSPPDRTFLILSRSQTSYIQAAIVGSNQLLLEYQDGSPEQHFRSARDDFSTSEVVKILEAYRRGEDSWRNENEWRLIDVSGQRDPWNRVRSVCLIAGIIMMVDAVFALKGGGRDAIFGLETMAVLSMAFLLLMISAIINLRRFRTMSPLSRSYDINAIIAGVVVVTIYLIERFTTR